FEGASGPAATREGRRPTAGHHVRPGGPGAARLISRIRRGLAAGLRARSMVLLAVAGGIFALEILLPPAVLSVARKPADYFTFNPWLPGLPGYLSDSNIPWERKLEFLPDLALFWFSADSPFGGTDWGFAVTVSDLLRFLLMALLFGVYFAMLLHYRAL